MFPDLRIAAIASLGFLVIACSGPATSPTAAPSPPVTATAAAPVSATATPADTPTSASTPARTATPLASPATSEVIRFVLDPEASEARFIVNEQLASLSLPSDAVGKTKAITGSIAVDSSGKIVPDQSKFSVDLTTLKTDDNRRDGYIQRNTLRTSEFPTAEFVPTEVRGLPSPLPTSGEVTFQLVGNLTTHGETRPVTWEVTGQVKSDSVTGQAKTSFKFGDFGMTPPRTAIALSVEDNIRLQVDFSLKRDA